VYRFEAPSGTTAGELRDLITAAKSKVTTSGYVLVGATVDEGKAAVVVTTDSVARDAGVKAQEVLVKVLAHLDGRGGGNAEMAQGGGTNTAALPQAFSAALDAVSDQ
jgi:alanyl-tRNA synthetase